ncbi:MAG: MlaD family protein [Actinomycetota bacterium]|nr:MCE family protein [Actinomycetota bacterium]
MKRAPLKLGVFALFTASITFALGSVIGNFHPFRSQYPIDATFEDATGLLAGDTVTIAGVSVGKVGNIGVEKGFAKVELLVNKSVRIPKQTRVIVRYQNLLGQRTVLLKPQGTAGPYIEAGGEIPVTQTEGPLRLDDVFNNLRPLLTNVKGADVNTLSKALVEGFAGHKEDLDAILANAAKTTSTLASHDTQLSGLVGGLGTTASTLSDQRQNLQALIKNLSDITATIAGKSSTFDKTLIDLDIASRDFARLISSNRPALDQDISDLKTLLDIVVKHQSDVDQIAQGLDDTLRATSRATGYGEWANLYVFSLCTLGSPGCSAADVTSHASTADFVRTQTKEPNPGLASLLSDGGQR